jgi:hypothetical protein
MTFILWSGVVLHELDNLDAEWHIDLPSLQFREQILDLVSFAFGIGFVDGPESEGAAIAQVTELAIPEITHALGGSHRV